MIHFTTVHVIQTANGFWTVSHGSKQRLTSICCLDKWRNLTGENIWTQIVLSRNKIAETLSSPHVSTCFLLSSASLRVYTLHVWNRLNFPATTWVRILVSLSELLESAGPQVRRARGGMCGCKHVYTCRRSSGYSRGHTGIHPLPLYKRLV